MVPLPFLVALLSFGSTTVPYPLRSVCAYCVVQSHALNSPVGLLYSSLCSLLSAVCARSTLLATVLQVAFFLTEGHVKRRGRRPALDRQVLARTLGSFASGRNVCSAVCSCLDRKQLALNLWALCCAWADPVSIHARIWSRQAQLASVCDSYGLLDAWSARAVAADGSKHSRPVTSSNSRRC
jgi:hypothetical protein